MTAQNYYEWRIRSPSRLYSLNYRGLLRIFLGMTKIFSSIPPFLCKSSRVRKRVLVFGVHFVHDQVSDLKHLCFYLFIYIQIKAWLCHYLFLEHENRAIRKAFFARNELSEHPLLTMGNKQFLDIPNR